ncbi:glycosyl transferase [Tritrichomonas foetus]|uniref:Glycosyl transferase n=1 Tax=Tritrichomonas foetus TaxID=1144522 RepID=A0A1J4KLM6_9EUKA|nr:glycosyl transferase [Tritrichomonas foetus]|eukprot:OHT10700.1 glycosyl transferase [Tritrichomonas foetus]
MFCFYLLSLALSTFRPDHAVSLGVVAPWYGVPLLEQVLFFLSDYSEFTATTFLTTVLSDNKADDTDFIWATAKSLIPEDSYTLLKSEIELGYYLPRAEMYRETARTFCGSSLLDLFALSSENAQLDFNSDIPVLPGNTISFDFDLSINKGTNFVYANMHNASVAKIILDMLKSDKSFILRPIGQTDKFGIPMRGYGIEMRPFKYSMEYGVKDTIVLDAAKKQESLEKDQTVSMVKGIPKSYVNVSNISNFGARFCGFLTQNSDKNFPRLLRDITGNMPLFMNEFAEAPIDETSFQNVKMISVDEKATSYLNGRQVPLQYIDAFTILDMINQESNIKNILESKFKASPEAIKHIFSTHLEASQTYLLDYESPNMTFWFNDIENDLRYQEWGTTVNELFTQIPRIRKNLLNVIYLADPSTPNGLTNFVYLHNLVIKEIPIRLGIIPHFSLGNRLSRKVAYAFHHIAKEDPRMAIQFLLKTINYVGIDPKTMTLNKVHEKHFASSYTEIINFLNEQDQTNRDDENEDGTKTFLEWDELHTLYDSKSYESKQITKYNQYYKQAGIGHSMILMNGKPMAMAHGVQNIIYEVQRAHQILASIVHKYHIMDIEHETALTLLRRDFLIVPSFDSGVLYDSVNTLKITEKPLSQQLAFTEFISTIEWNYTDEGRSTSFYMLFSKDEKEIHDFMEFAQHHPHQAPSMFVVNPPMHERLASIFQFDFEKTTLIADGRVFNMKQPITTDLLTVIDTWVDHVISQPLNRTMKKIKYKRTEVMVYMSMVAADWLAEGISRTLLNDRVWDILSSAIYDSNHTERLSWEIIANPFTREFQRVAGIIDYLQDIVNVKMIIIPPSTLQEPMTTYYRNALTEDRAVFTMLNDTTTYSVMADMPDSWIFESMKASVDLDNILLSELNPATHEGTYILTNVKAEGTCETTEGRYTEGAELALFDTNGVRQSDTIVMRTNGYWQLAANPGIWTIDLGGSRSKNIYSMVTKTLIVSGFGRGSKSLTLSVNPGMEGLSVSNLSVTPTTNTTRVDVFSVASGHLYERLLKIMMLAVRRRSIYNVKFWIIKAFLSPQFKATLPIMAKKYNFSYQLVSYKWPQWLYPQYEKQRIIWGNKILFLDTIFPLDLERVIYIDSDQIVRTDLIELMRMDFGDAPYAFTPFCDSRTETEPFRFWKQGYWLNLLKGKKYHISALFAIDLRRFRQMMAGDWLRYHYQQLAPDPNSLSNLDQDLPNYAQIHIPIYSLPQNWLWCETWCSDETMDDAKTIDLCNNPLTKKPKLYVAQTMVKEWPGLDEEVRNISAGPDEYEKFFFPDKENKN